MARPLRVEYAGAIYHVTSRGNAQSDIYLDDSDREAFLEILAGVIDRFGWVCHAYCLMSNHYHLLLETPKGNLSMGMRQLNGVYTQRFNRRHRRVGHLFQGRYKSKSLWICLASAWLGTRTATLAPESAHTAATVPYTAVLPEPTPPDNIRCIVP